MDIPKSDRAIRTDTLRKMLSEGYSDEALKALIFDHFDSLYDDLTPTLPLSKMVQMLLAYAKNTRELDKIAKIIKKHNPSKYIEHEQNLFEKDIEETLKSSASKENGGSERHLPKKTREIPFSKLFTLKTYVALLDKCIDLIEVSDVIRRDIRGLRDQIETLFPLTSSETWNITSANIVIKGIYIPFNTLWHHVDNDLQQIENYEEKLDIDSSQKEEILKTASNLRKELDKLNIIKTMHNQIQNPTEHESSEIINGSREHIDNLRVSIVEINKSATRVRVDLFKVLKLQVEKLSAEFIDI